MKTFVQAVEIWVPDAEGLLLEFGDGLYGRASALGAVSRSMCFGRGEGLPGRVWEERRPIILKDLHDGYFRRSAAAKAARLTCAVALPVYLDDALKAVVVFFCGGDSPAAGAIELWRNDSRVTPDMMLVDGYYGATAAAFESASGETYLPRGAGLPGLAWQRQSSVFLNGLADSKKFVRAEEAAAAGIQRGLAIPCPVPTRENYALAFLSASETPFAQCIESWAPHGADHALQRAFGFSETTGALPVGEALAMANGAGDAIAHAFASAVPQLQQRAGDASTELGGMLALPIVSDGEVADVVALYF